MPDSRLLLHRCELHGETACGWCEKPTRIIDLFAGPGGWSEGLRMLGYSELGIELDENACATAIAAGHGRLQADVAALDPAAYSCWGMIGSPPCPTFSAAGNGAGGLLTEIIVECARALVDGRDTRGAAKAEAFGVLHAGKRPPKIDDEKWWQRCTRDAAMSILVVEPLRWALELRPEWIALEQVPPVLELWTAFGHILEQLGYSVWVGVLEAERYGVPQTRERAILMASRVRTVHPPRPTHQRYVPGQPQRHDETMDGKILPWVSMAEALGWGMTQRPGLTFAPGTANGGAAYEGGSGARAALRRERERGAWVVQTGNFTALARDGDGERSKRGSVRYERTVDAPAPVVTGNVDRWGLDRRQGGAPVRTMDEPAHTMSSAGLAKGRDVWVHERPTTAVNGDPIRVTVPEAAALQSFRPDYPWQGTKSKIYQQIGNAVPPLLARAVLAELVGEAELEAAA